MSLVEIHVHRVRAITMLQSTLHPRYNLFYGENGSGKTSLLEAIYLLSHGHSFRTRETSPLIQHGASNLMLFAQTETGDTISLQKTAIGSTRVLLNQQPCLRGSDLARFLPCQVFYHELFQIIDAGPATRRDVLDKGLFHVKQSYLALWREYRHALKQRNALLRQNAPAAQFEPWDHALGELALALDLDRAAYVEAWSEAFQHYLSLLTDVKCFMRYERGWDKKNTGVGLAMLLKQQMAQDRQRQYTHLGAHQADIILEGNTLNAKKHFSRGQQKIILIALKLAQAHVLGRPCLYLFDDVLAELDTPHLQRLVACLATLPGQFFFTGVDIASLSTLFSDHHAVKLPIG